MFDSDPLFVNTNCYSRHKFCLPICNAGQRTVLAAHVLQANKQPPVQDRQLL